VARMGEERKVCNVLGESQMKFPPCVTCEHPVLGYIKPYHQYYLQSASCCVVYNKIHNILTVNTNFVTCA
jgi:hypothetical protein